MNGKMKALVLAVSAMLIVIMTVFATVAYLTAQDTVTNTFTVGKVNITLDETDVKLDGTKDTDTDTRVKENTYKLMPGHSYIKDPIVHVDATSEACWIFVKVENAIEKIEGLKKVAAQMEDNGWRAVTGATNVYAYNQIVSANENIPVFETFQIKGDVSSNDLAAYQNKTIVVTAYAVQADGFTTAQDAWNAANFS